MSVIGERRDDPPTKAPSWGWSMQVRLGDVLTMLTIVVIGVYNYSKLEGRVMLVESSIATQEKAVLLDAAERLRTTGELKADLREIRQDLKALNSSVTQRQSK